MRRRPTVVRKSCERLKASAQLDANAQTRGGAELPVGGRTHCATLTQRCALGLAAVAVKLALRARRGRLYCCMACTATSNTTAARLRTRPFTSRHAPATSAPPTTPACSRRPGRRRAAPTRGGSTASTRRGCAGRVCARFVRALWPLAWLESVSHALHVHARVARPRHMSVHTRAALTSVRTATYM